MGPTTESPNKVSPTALLHLETAPIQIRKILVATDFSEPAEQALQAALAIAQLYHSDLLLAHASLYTTFVTAEGVIPAEFLIDQLLEDKKLMQDLVTNHTGLAPLHVDTIVEYATPVTLIESLVEKNKIDLVVLGSHGASGLERIALGSVAESIAYSIPVPVLIMGPHANKEQDPFRSIVFATDLSSTGLRPAQYASSLAERFHSQLLVLHVEEDRLNTSAIQSEVESRMLQDMQSLLPADAALACHPQFRIEYGAPADEIAAAAREVGASLVVVGARHKRALADHLPWLTLSKVIREAGCGVLVVGNRLL